jgi:RNA polymerase sigma-32 factor
MVREYAETLTGDKESPVLDSLKRYLFEISRYPRLTREEEFDLSRRTYDLKDPGAAHKLVVSHLTLVVKIAFKYRSMGCDPLDLIQEGNVGLLHSVGRYNPHKGVTFPGYASFWIRAYMIKYLRGAHSLITLGKTEEERKLFFGLGRETRSLEVRGIVPTVEVLSRTLSSRKEDIRDMQMRLAGNVLSLETPITRKDRTLLLMDTIRSDVDVEAIINGREESHIIEEALNRFRESLNTKEVYVLDHRILADEPLTLQEIGETLKITRERVRQIEGIVRTALRKRFAPGI